MYKLKVRVIEKLRIIYKNKYIHELWVYNLKIDKEGQYTWLHYDQGNRIIDLQPSEISSIYVVKRKKVLYWSKVRKIKKKPKPEIVLDQFRPKQPPLAIRQETKVEEVIAPPKEKTGFWN